MKTLLLTPKIARRLANVTLIVTGARVFFVLCLIAVQSLYRYTDRTELSGEARGWTTRNRSKVVRP